MVSDFTNPALWVAVAGVLSALGAIIASLRNGNKIDATQQSLDQSKQQLQEVHDNTNGTLRQLHEHIVSLSLTQATPEELAARAAKAAPVAAEK